MKKVLIGLILSIFFAASSDMASAKSVPAAEINERTLKSTESFIQDLGNIAIRVINRPKITDEEVRQEFSKLLTENFAVDSIARYSLGKNFRLLSDSDKADFMKCFKNMLVKMYTSRFTEYKTAKLVVTGARKKSSKQALVTSKIVVQGKPDIDIVWSVYAIKGFLKVYDVIISDVSISNVQRSEFTGKISEKGLKIFLKDFKENYK